MIQKKVQIMKITEMYVSNYKNLKDCLIHPDGLFALTGCNSTGKSNFLEVFRFVSLFMSGENITSGQSIMGGLSFNTINWVPEPNTAEPLEIRFVCTLQVNSINWEIKYELQITQALFNDNLESTINSVRVEIEDVFIKEVGKPGRPKKVIERISNGDTKTSRIEDPRKEYTFKTKSDMSALKALEVREADTFVKNYAVLAEFKKVFLASMLLRINPEKLIKNSIINGSNSPLSLKGSIVDELPLFDLIKKIQRGDQKQEFEYWLKKLCNIDKIEAHELPIKGDSNIRFLMVTQFNRTQQTDQLSTGCAMLLGLLVAAYSYLRENGFILLEEPESYLHPKAIVDFLTLLREFSETKTVLFTTHSPVVLNSMKPEEVALMVQLPDFRTTTKNVADIKEATDALSTSFVSFGDLLQTNFNLPQS
jgi:predicted ATPase